MCEFSANVIHELMLFFWLKCGQASATEWDFWGSGGKWKFEGIGANEVCGMHYSSGATPADRLMETYMR